jgi:hypothetical protein
MAVNLSPVGGVAAQFFTNTGAVLTGGKLYTYLAGTTTPVTTYTTSAGNVAWTNPIVLDAAGRVSGSGEIWLTVGVTYKFVLKDSNEVLIGTYDNVLGGVDSSNVVYQPAGVGAVATTVQAKLRESISVKDFGAVGNGSTDDTAAINAALSSIGTTTVNSLIFPQGTYLVTSNQDWSTYLNITFEFMPGAVISHSTYTLVFPQNIDTGQAINDILNGSGAVTFKNKNVIPFTTPQPAGWFQTTNFAMGPNAGVGNTAGTNNFSWGVSALEKNTTGSSNIAIGNFACQNVDGAGIPLPAPGTFTGRGWNNIGIGDYALGKTTNGYENLAIGALALQNNTTGAWNVAIGHDSQILNTIGSQNVSVGAYNLVINTGNSNVAIGWAVGEGNTTGDMTAVGFTCMNANTTGVQNTAVGNSASYWNQTGSYNTSHGDHALWRNAGSGHTAVGHYALAYLDSDFNVTVDVDNVAVGRIALGALLTGSSNTAVGTGALSVSTSVSNSAGLGKSAQVTGDNQVQLGDSLTTTYAWGAVQNRSDERDKADIRPTVLGLDFIDALNPVDFKWDIREDYRTPPPVAPTPPQGSERDPAYKQQLDSYNLAMETYRVEFDNWKAASSHAQLVRDGSKKRSRYHHGLIAQQVKAVMDEYGVDFGGYQDHSIKGGDDVLSLGYEQLIGPMIKAIQELKKEIEVLKAKI